MKFLEEAKKEQIRVLTGFGLKCVVFLGQIAERYHDHRSEDFSDCWINLKLLHKQFQENVIKQHAYYYEKKIAK